MTAKPTTAQMKTLRTIIANGGEMNGYAGQPGFYCNSVGPMVRNGWIEKVEPCQPCATNDDWTNGVCERPLRGQSGGQRCYRRVRVTEAGRHACVEQTPAAPCPVCVYGEPTDHTCDEGQRHRHQVESRGRL